MSRRKQARPKSCKAEDQDSDNNSVRIKKEAEEEEEEEEEATMGNEDGLGCSKEATTTEGNECPISNPTKDTVKNEPTTSELALETMTSSPEYHDVIPFVAVEPMDETGDMKEIRCEPCGLKFESLDTFMDHRNTDCRVDKADLKSTSWLLQETSNSDSISPSSQSTYGGGMDDSSGSVGGAEDGGEGEGLRLDDLDPSDIPYVIGVTTDNPYGCTFCEKAFAFLSYLHRHEQTHSAQMPYKCAHCPRQFRHQKSRERHEKLHSADRKYRCKICGVGYSRSDHLRNHMKNHDSTEKGDNSHKCPLCSLSFSSPITLANHLKKHKEEEEGSPDSMSKSCLDCHQVFGSEPEMMQHACPSVGDEQDSQTSTLELKCPVCSDMFASMESLCHHLMCHRTLNMDTGGPSTSSLSSSSTSPSTSSPSAAAAAAAAKTSAKLSTDRSTGFGLVEENKENKVLDPDNQSSSTSSNPLVCPYCLIEGFESLESLELHLTSVHNVKPTEVYTCNYCNAPYPNLYSLHDHMTVVHRSQHGLDITYPCSMCVQRFHSLDALAKHKGIVHAQQRSTGIDAAFCNRCNMTLSSPRSLEDHMATVHNIIMEKRPISASKHNNKGKKSSGKHNNNNNKGNTTLHKDINGGVTHHRPSKTPTSPKKQPFSHPTHSKTSSADGADIRTAKSSASSSSSPSSSSSLTTSPALLTSSSSSSFPETTSSYALPFALGGDSTKASNALRITSLLAKKMADMSPGPDKSFESSGMTCDHCNATFYDIQNYTAHLLHHTGSASAFNTSSQASVATAASAIASPGSRDKWSSFQQHARPSSPRDSTSQNGPGRRAALRSGSLPGDDTTRNTPNECFKCQATFPTNEQLEAHLLLHYLRVSTEYGCSSCAKNFSKPDELQRHLMDIHAHHLYRCSLCKEIFDSKVNIQVHFAIKHSDECKLYRCAACELIFHSEMEWQVHVRVNHLHISRPYRCLFCQESFTSEVELQCHLTTHSKPFVCPMCSQAFHIEYLLDQHMQQNHGDVKPTLAQTSLEPCSPSPLSLLIPTTIKMEQEAEQEPTTHSGNASPSLSPHYSTITTASLQNRIYSNNNNININKTSGDNILPTTSSSSSHHATKTILKSPTASTLGKLSHNSSHSQGQGRSSSSTARGNRSIPGLSGGNSIPAVWKNSEPLHMCNICDIKFNDFNLLMIHKAQDHDLKNLGKGMDKSRDDGCKGDKGIIESITNDNNLLVSALSNGSNKHTGDTPPNGQMARGGGGGGGASGGISGEATPSTNSYSHAISMTSSSSSTTTPTHPATPPSCMFCSQTFKNNAEYEKHMKIHVNSGNLTCSICDETFSSTSVLAEHKLTHCKIQQGNTCVVCRVTLCNKEQFYAHTQEHGFEGTQLQCVVCRQSLSSLVELQMHGRHHFQSQASFFTCCVCLKSFESRENLVSKLNATGRTYYVCKPCYHGEAPPLHTCSQCSEKFATAQLLDVHMLTHKQSSFQCIKCQQSFSCEYEIQLHVATHLMNEGTQHECRLCGTSCDTPARLQTHLIQHSFSGTDITCFVCKKSFESPQEIQVHVLEHSSSFKKYSCRKCTQRFFFTAELENHKLTYNHLSDSNSPPAAPNSSSSPARSSTPPSSLTTSSASPPPKSSSSSSNFHASALLASLSASPLNPASDSSPLSSEFQFSKLFSSPQFGKSSYSVKDTPHLPSKHRLSVTSSSSSPSAAKVMKLDKNKKKSGMSGGTLTIPHPPSSSSSSSSSSRRLECSDCHKFFTTGTALANHRKTHARKEAKNGIKCSLCDEGFPSANAMQQHFFSTHSARAKKEEEEAEEKKPLFECMMCEKACATLSALQNHILSHSTQSIGSCSKLNPQKTSSKTNRETDCEAMEIQQRGDELEEEDLASEDTCLLACPVCNQVFLKAEDIDDHIKTHQELFIFQSNEDGNGEATDKPEEEKVEDGAESDAKVEQEEDTEVAL